jgi:hypothetical protein
MRLSASLEAALERGGISAGRHLDRRDDSRAIVDVVKHQQGVHHHEERVGKVAVVGRRIGKVFECPRHIVAHEADGAAR